MKKMKSLLGGTFAAVYFIFPMGLVILLLAFTPIMFMSDVSAIRTSGFAGPGSAITMIGVCGFIIGLSLLIPPLRRMYAVLPWLYSFVKIFFISLVILNIGISILNYGYQTVNSTRHTIFYLLMIAFIITGRIAMCVYFKWKPVNIDRKGLKS